MQRSELERGSFEPDGMSAHQSSSGVLLLRHLVGVQLCIIERDPEQDPGIKIQFLAKTPIRHETLNKFQPLGLFPHLCSGGRAQIRPQSRFVKRLK